METLWCILLYLVLIISPGTYTYQQIHTIEQQNQLAIQSVQQNPALMNYVVKTYMEDAKRIDVYEQPEH